MQVLDGVRIVEWREAMAGPYAAMLLGDLGADVIKVERRGTGDRRGRGDHRWLEPSRPIAVG